MKEAYFIHLFILITFDIQNKYDLLNRLIMTKGMIKVSVLYQNIEGKKFDMDYYCNTHIPMVKELLGVALKGATVEKGLGGAVPF